MHYPVKIVQLVFYKHYLKAAEAAAVVKLHKAEGLAVAHGARPAGNGYCFIIIAFRMSKEFLDIHTIHIKGVLSFIWRQSAEYFCRAAVRCRHFCFLVLVAATKGLLQ